MDKTTYEARHPPLEILLAEVIIEDHISMEPRAPKELHVRAGQPIRLLVDYTIFEAGPAKEHYRLELRSRAGPYVVAPARKNIHDIPVVRDDRSGRLEQQYIIPDAGEHALHYEVLANYTQHGRLSKEKAKDEAQMHEGIVLLVVGE